MCFAVTNIKFGRAKVCLLENMPFFDPALQKYL